jgi:hypothetical protein
MGQPGFFVARKADKPAQPAILDSEIAQCLFPRLACFYFLVSLTSARRQCTAAGVKLDTFQEVLTR